jgi:hypothetical protein
MQELRQGKLLKIEERETMCDDVLAIAKFDNLWVGKELLYHKSTDKIMWNIRAPNVGLVDHALSCSHFLRFCASTA